MSFTQVLPFAPFACVRFGGLGGCRTSLYCLWPQCNTAPRLSLSLSNFMRPKHSFSGAAPTPQDVLIDRGGANPSSYLCWSLLMLSLDMPARLKEHHSESSSRNVFGRNRPFLTFLIILSCFFVADAIVRPFGHEALVIDNCL